MRNMRLGVVLLAAILPLAAHHSTRGKFDDRQIVTMNAVVREVIWMNPHANLLVTVTDPAANAAEWRIELPPPGLLLGRGWKRHDLEAGDRVTLGVWLAKDGGKVAAMRTITLPDGRVIAGDSAWDGPLKLQ